MAQRDPAKALTIPSSIGPFSLRESVTYPNGGNSRFCTCGSTALVVDDGICDLSPNGIVFDYALITNKQNAYVSQYDRLYRLLIEDLDQLERYLTRKDIELDANVTKRRTGDRSNLADASPLEHSFEEHFANVYGDNSTRFLTREYGVTNLDGTTGFIDYVVRNKSGLIGVEQNGVSFHHPQLIGKDKYRNQLAKQNTCQLLGIKIYRFSTEDIRFTERFEDDIRSYFGRTTDSFVDADIVVERPFELYEHQEGALDEMERRRTEGTRSFLAVLPTGTGKSQIVLEDLARFAPTQPSFKALVAAPNTTIVNDWQARIAQALPRLQGDILVCTYSYINRHYTEYAPEHFSYIVIDEAHHAVAPALKRTIQHFDPVFLVGLTATDQRPDKLSLKAVFGSYRVGLSLADAMERGIVATARAFCIETNVGLSPTRINGRDYVNVDLEKTLRVTSRNELIVDVLREYFGEGAAGRRQGVVFCASVRFLCSCQMISEGWDHPGLGIPVMARPTLSRVLYLQQLGRGLRRTPSKRDAFVNDVVDEYGTMAAPCSLHPVFQNPYSPAPPRRPARRWNGPRTIERPQTCFTYPVITYQA